MKGAMTGGSSRAESVLQRKMMLGDLLDLPSFTDMVRGLGDLYRVGIQVVDGRGVKLVEALPPGAAGEPGPGCVTLPVRWEGDELGRVIFGPFPPEEAVELPPGLQELLGRDLSSLQEQLSRLPRLPQHPLVGMVVHFSQVLAALLAAGQKAYLTSEVHMESSISSHRELEAQNAQLVRLNQRLQEADRLKSSFLSTVSHELRTPLASIIGYSEMLAEGLVGELNAEQLQFVRTIVDKGNTLLHLIGSILDMSQIEAGKVRLAFEWVDVMGLVQESLSTVVPQAQRKNLVVEVRGPEEPQPRVTADREKLQQVVVNLLANAVKFTPDGGRVELRVSSVGMQPEIGLQGYRIEVEDNGVGIPDDQLERIFQSFYQVDDGPTRQYGGAGLGLAIVKSYVEGHGGQVWATSQRGRGSRFTVVMPKEPPKADAGPSFIPPPISEPDRF
jgi:signal transduction histidine kinase